MYRIQYKPKYINTLLIVNFLLSIAELSVCPLLYSDHFVSGSAVDVVHDLWLTKSDVRGIRFGPALIL